VVARSGGQLAKDVKKSENEVSFAHFAFPLRPLRFFLKDTRERPARFVDKAPQMSYSAVMFTHSENQRFLERPRVDRLLEKALQSHVVTVVAGEGSGKTHAVNAFLQKEKRKAVWVQISERDNLAWRFWENYTGAVARLNPEAAKVLADMGLPESDRLFDRWLALINSEIISRERYALVFDDFHLMTNSMILSRLERTLTDPVSKNTIVFISHTDPSLSTVNLLSKGLLSQITADDLRFTREETAGYFRREVYGRIER
jgi:LuxR family maltose regulon positive regulatory protein